MESKVKPIPAFYCCYLLRSTIRHGSLYVGSSPNPVRRLDQHNGRVKGGAVRTSRLSLRPWEMTCIVAGFPSNIAALQFEWAWQNSHLTRHIAQDERISFPVTKIRTNSKTGKTRKKPTRPPSSLIDKLSNLHLLLRSKYFSKWPLQLRFFNKDVYETWRRWCGRVDRQLKPDIQVLLDLPPQQQPQTNDVEFTSAQQPKKRSKIDLIGKGGVEGVDPTYSRYQDVFEKSIFLLDEGDEQHCQVCKKAIDLQMDVFTICTSNGCRSLSHVTCLSSEFLRTAGEEQMVPSRGKCPGCQTEVVWSDLMRVVSLRMRGEKEIGRLLKKKRGTKATTAARVMDEEESDDDDDDEEELISADLADEDERNAAEDEDDDDDDDAMTVTSTGSSASIMADIRSPGRNNKVPIDAKLEIVIEDSEDER